MISNLPFSKTRTSSGLSKRLTMTSYTIAPLAARKYLNNWIAGKKKGRDFPRGRPASSLLVVLLEWLCAKDECGCLQQPAPSPAPGRLLSVRREHLLCDVRRLR